MFEELSQKLEEFGQWVNGKGIPIPLARVNGRASLSASLVVVSGGLCAISVLMMLAVGFSKFSGFFIITDAISQSVQNAFTDSLQFFLSCTPLYWARNYKRDEKGAISIEPVDKNKPQA